MWANAEVGLLMTWPTGGSVRLYGGGGQLIAHGTCTGPRCGGLIGDRLPYFGIAIGHTL
jgi:hypothetical protein